MRRLVGLLAGTALLLGGCSADGLLGGGLPGGAAQGDGYDVQVVFDDVLDLVNQSAVKVDDVPVGSVTGIELDDFQARVSLRINADVQLPANAVAELRQTSLLGEKFIELGPPATGATGRLVDGDVIPSTRASRNPEVEEVFSALAALLTGGGLTELQTIAVELSRALAGREEQVRSAFRRVERLVGALDERKSEVVRAIDALDRLGATLAGQRQVLVEALDDITPAITVLADQRAELTHLLRKLSDLGAVGTRVVKATRDDTLANLRLLQPIVAQVVTVKAELARSVDQLVRFTRVVPRAIPGDYLQLLVTLYFDPSTLPVAPGQPSPSRPRVTLPGLPAAAGVVPPSTGARTLGDLLAGGVR